MMQILNEYFFHYNPNEKLWYAFMKDDTTKYLKGIKKISMRCADLDELVTDILIKHNVILDETEV